LVLCAPARRCAARAAGSLQYAETAEEENWDLDFDEFPDDESASGEDEPLDWPLGNADAWSDGGQYASRPLVASGAPWSAQGPLMCNANRP
jgi:hypothetical protein